MVKGVLAGFWLIFVPVAADVYKRQVVDLDALTKISRQLDVSMGSMMGMVNGFAIVIYMVLIYLLSKIIIEKMCIRDRRKSVSSAQT